MIELTRNISKPHYHIKFSAGCKFFKNLSRCGNSLIIVNWNGAKFFLSSAWRNSNCLELHTDASGALDYGGIFGGKWFQGKWEPRQQLGQPEISIAWQELFAIVVACHVWGKFNETMINILSKETLVNLSNFRGKGCFVYGEYACCVFVGMKCSQRSPSTP